MKKTNVIELTILAAIFGLVFYAPGFSALRDNPRNSGAAEDSAYGEAGLSGDMQAGNDAAGAGISEGQEAMELESAAVPEKEKVAPRKKKKKIYSGEQAFIAGPDWEFDGFVVGGMDQEVKSMYLVNDLIYLNVGLSHGFQPGDRMGIYKRGDRIRDPQSGRFLGYQVKRIATVEVTNKIEDETCSVQVISANIGIEIGDLVRRDR